MSRAIVTLIQQSQQILDSMGPKIKQEANKKIAEVKNKIPNKESVKQMMLDEVTSKGPELVCSIEVRTRIGRIYNKAVYQRYDGYIKHPKFYRHVTYNFSNINSSTPRYNTFWRNIKLLIILFFHTSLHTSQGSRVL